METKMMTCIICPRGCKMSVEIDNEKVLSCQGNFCIRGKNMLKLK
jgi:CxxC motif-containing protein